MNRKDFYYTNEKDPLRGKTIFVYTHSDHYVVTLKDNRKVVTNSSAKSGIYIPSFVVLFDVNDLDEEKADKLKYKFDCKLPMGFIKGLCGKYNNEDPTNSEVDYLAYLLLSDDIELIKSLCNGFNPKEILTMEDARKLDIFGHHIPSSSNDAVRMYNTQEVYYGYGRKKSS